ncbi:hypothetical protein NDU88_004903 [Pleurodeles waltl]|uniref:Uncharacterized protein n=1 Tax=Pleurodeles waltl TaxID=8319 RepID=A0AAV7L170_PLEWA|nr:hypothetical protein NDU88_004903 [Pleurodeles waltl]
MSIIPCPKLLKCRVLMCAGYEVLRSVELLARRLARATSGAELNVYCAQLSDARKTLAELKTGKEASKNPVSRGITTSLLERS